jgi:hypothetical protein
LGHIDGGAGNGAITIHRADDVLLATITLTRPAGTVNGTTGVLTLAQQTREDDAPAAGNADYATIRDSSGTALRSMPCVAGLNPVVGSCVLNTVEVELGGRVELVSAVIS